MLGARHESRRVDHAGQICSGNCLLARSDKTSSKTLHARTHHLEGQGCRVQGSDVEAEPGTARRKAGGSSADAGVLFICTCTTKRGVDFEIPSAGNQTKA